MVKEGVIVKEISAIKKKPIIFHQDNRKEVLIPQELARPTTESRM
jgi:hypothetical protein